MKDLKIGDKVTVKRVSSVEYNEHNAKVLCRSVTTPFEAVITGQKRKFIGDYRQGYNTGGYFGEDDRTSTYLRVSGSYLLWCVRREGKPCGREMLVHDDDLVAITNN